MGVLRDKIASGPAASGNNATSDLALTIAANPNRYLLVFVTQYFGSTTLPNVPASVVWNGTEALTMLWEEGQTTTNAGCRVSCWGLKNPSAVAANVRVTNAAASGGTGGGIIAISDYNVDQTTPVTGIIQTGSGSGATANAPRFYAPPPPSPVGSKVYAAGARAWSAVATPSAVIPGNAPSFVAGNGSVVVSGTSVTPSMPAVGGILANGLLTATVVTKNAADTHSCSTAGWTKVRELHGTAITVSYWEADGAAAQPTFTWANVGPGQARVVNYRDTWRTPLPLGPSNNGTGSPHSSAGGVTTVDNSLAVYNGAATTSTGFGAPGGGWTEDDDAGGGAATTAIVNGSRVVTPIGASGALSITGSTAEWIQQQFELRPGPAQVLEATATHTAGNRVIVAVTSEDGDTKNQIGLSILPNANATPFAGGALILMPAASVVSIQPTTHQNTQTFYGPALKVTYKPTLHTNAQAFFGHKLSHTKTAPFHTNAQAFYAPKLRMTVKLGARHQNQQTFYAPAIEVTVPSGIVEPPFHQNQQEFYAPAITFAGLVKPPLHTNAQTFYPPTIKFTYTVSLAALHQNQQAFFGPTIFIYTPPEPITLDVPFHQNTQSFFAPTIFVAPVTRFFAPFHQNRQTFYGPYINITPRPPDGGARGAIGPGWWSKGMTPERRKRRAEEKNIWILPSAAELPPVVMSPPIVVTQAEARQNALARKRMLDELKESSRRYNAREKIIEDQIVGIIVKALVDE